MERLEPQELERRIGSVRTSPPGMLANKATDLLRRTGGQVALTIDPKGDVWAERPHEAAEADLVGVYTYTGLMEAYRAILDDLRHVMGVAA